jgi:hypothetical protein
MPDLYHFMFLKEAEDEEEKSEPWTVESATKLLTEQNINPIETVENDRLIILTVAPKPDKDVDVRIVQLTKTVFMLVEDKGFDLEGEEPTLPVADPVLERQNSI